MVTFKRACSRAGKVKYALLGWLIGLPLPIILILLFVRGCDF
jgi:Na+-driven multidrug efflux pump